MRRFLFNVSGGYGHLHPLVPLARGMKEAGHEVAFTVGRSLLPVVEAAGFEAFPVGGHRADDPEYRQLRARLDAMPTGLDTELFAYPRLFCGIGSRLATPDLVAICKAWQPDMLVRETATYSAVVAAEHLGLAHAAVSFATSLKGLAAFEREIPEHLDPVRQSWGLPPDPVGQALYRYLLLVYSPPSFALEGVEYGEAGTVRSMPPTAHFIRPEIFDNAGDESLPGWVEGLRANGRPTVYATLGTEANSEPGIYPYVLQTIIEGLRDLPVNLVVTLGRDRDPADFGPQPDNVHIERYIPQSLLLPLCDLMVMHGGSNTVLAALDVGLPTVVVPLIADQFFNARVIERLGLGKVVRTWPTQEPGRIELAEISAASVRAAVREVLDNPAYRQNVERVGAEMRALPGQDHAVELVESVAAGHQPVS